MSAYIKFFLSTLFLSHFSFSSDWASMGQKELSESYQIAVQRSQVMQEYYYLLYGKEKSISDIEIKKIAWSLGSKLNNIESYIEKYLTKKAFMNESFLAERCVKLWATPTQILRLSVDYFKDWNQISQNSTESIFRKLQVDLLLNYINVALIRKFSLDEDLGKTLFSKVGVACEFKHRKEILSQLINIQQKMSELYLSAHGSKGLRNLNEDLKIASEASVKHYQRQLYLVFPKLVVIAGIPFFAQLKLVSLISKSSSLLAKTSYLGLNASLSGYFAYGLVDQSLDDSDQLLKIDLLDLIKVKDLFISGDQDRFLDLIDIHREMNSSMEENLLKLNYDFNQKFTFIKRGLQKHKTELGYLNYLKQIKLELESEIQNLN